MAAPYMGQMGGSDLLSRQRYNSHIQNNEENLAKPCSL